MIRGIITTRKATGDVYFLNRAGESILPPSKNVEVLVRENFYGNSLRDAIESARQFVAGAIRNKIDQKMRGHDCTPIVRNIRIGYKIKQNFSKCTSYERLLHYRAGDCIIRKGDRGSEFFLVKTGVVDISGMPYKAGSVFGRAAFSDGIRKMDAFAKTEVTLVAIDKRHPSLNKKISTLANKFAEETRNIKQVRPQAELDTVCFV